jgi:20S proteasome alpha/beta subunit
MGADSASTDASSGTRQTVGKIEQIGSHPILFGGSGDVGLIKRILEELNTSNLKHPNFKTTRRSIKDAVLPHMREAKEDHIPQKGFADPPTATLMLGCIQNTQPMILEVEMDGRDTVYDKSYGSFNAIGSGKALAQALMRNHLHTTPRNLRLGKILAYRVLEDAINIAAFGLAKPIRLYTMDVKGVVSVVDEGEIKQLEQECELWRELERESLGPVLSPTSAAETDSAIPQPDLEDATG